MSKVTRIFNRSFTTLIRNAVVANNQSLKSVSLKYMPCVQSNFVRCKTNVASLADKDLLSFLTEEIENENKSLENKGTLPTIQGFTSKFEDAKVVLTKSSGSENIKVIFNVNNSLDHVNNENFSETAEQAPETDQVPISKPNYTIEIQKSNGQILAFYCSFMEDHYEEDGSDTSPDTASYSDLFRIDEISLYEGSYNDDCYAVSCDLLDEQMYEKLFNMLEERGLGNEFANKIAELSSMYEHKLYVNLLSKIKNFISS